MKNKNSLETMKKKLSLKKKSISIFDKNMRRNIKGGDSPSPTTGNGTVVGTTSNTGTVGTIGTAVTTVLYTLLCDK